MPCQSAWMTAHFQTLQEGASTEEAERVSSGLEEVQKLVQALQVRTATSV